VLTVTNTELSGRIREDVKIKKFNLLVRAYDLGMIFFQVKFRVSHKSKTMGKFKVLTHMVQNMFLATTYFGLWGRIVWRKPDVSVVTV
jgi:hypothetical protein